MSQILLATCRLISGRKKLLHVSPNRTCRICKSTVFMCCIFLPVKVWLFCESGTGNSFFLILTNTFNLYVYNRDQKFICHAEGTGHNVDVG